MRFPLEKRDGARIALSPVMRQKFEADGFELPLLHFAQRGKQVFLYRLDFRLHRCDHPVACRLQHKRIGAAIFCRSNARNKAFLFEPVDDAAHGCPVISDQGGKCCLPNVRAIADRAERRKLHGRQVTIYFLGEQPHSDLLQSPHKMTGHRMDEEATASRFAGSRFSAGS